MNILYCGDENIENGLIISVLSLLKHVKEELKIYVLTMNMQSEKKIFKEISSNSINFLNNRVKQENAESFVKKIDITNLFESSVPIKNMHTRFTPYCMIRLFADEIEELPEKILYLDTDVVCRKNFTEFYNQDITNYELVRSIRPLWKMVF